MYQSNWQDCEFPLELHAGHVIRMPLPGRAEVLFLNVTDSVRFEGVIDLFEYLKGQHPAVEVSVERKPS